MVLNISAPQKAQRLPPQQNTSTPYKDLFVNSGYTPLSIMTYQTVIHWRNNSNHLFGSILKRTGTSFCLLALSAITVIEGVVRLSLACIAYLFSWIAIEFGKRKLFFNAYKHLMAGVSINAVLLPTCIASLATNLYAKRI